MNTARYYVALLTVVVFPPPLIAWLIIHPLADKLRQIGLKGTYLCIFGFYAAGMLSIWLVRDYILSINYGFSAPLLGLSMVLLCLSIYVRVLWRRILRPSTIFGLPEIRGMHEPSNLVTEGIYSRVRHPRYLEVGLGLWAAAFFSNYLAIYVIGLAYIPLINLIVRLEECELRNRFGTLYDNYCSKVPRFIPRIKFLSLNRD